MKFSKTMLLASSALLCAACGGGGSTDKETIKTSVKMGFTAARIGGHLLDEDKVNHYTVVKYAFGTTADYTLKATDFTISAGNTQYIGKSFALAADDPDYPAIVTKKAEELKLTSTMFVLFDQDLDYLATDPIGTIKDNTDIRLFTAKDITLKK